MTRSYNGFTPDEIGHWSRRHYAGLRKHPERRVNVCEACGIDSHVDQHLEDYTRPVEGIIGLCIRCHVVTHGRFDHPEVWNRYVGMIRDGSRFPAMKHPMTAKAEMLNRPGGCDVGVDGPPRGRTILDDIADGRWLKVGVTSRPA